MRECCEMVSGILVVICVAGVLLGEPGYAQQISKTSFSCNGRVSGYYADVSTGCQVYHMCDGVGRQFSYTCPNATLFQQRMLICDHWYMVNCSRATADYSANLLIGQKDKHFVEDSEINPYSRTPRPDLLVAPSNLTEYNIIYRTGGQNLSPQNFVGVESEDENTTDQPTYFPPSHWSAEISKQRTTSEPLEIDHRINGQIQQNDFQRRQSGIPQRSFQRGSQIYRNGFERGVPRSQENNIERISQYDDDTNSRRNVQNYNGRGKAIDVFSSNKHKNNFVVVNFKSNFKATTPVYPQSVEDTTRSPNNIGLLPPLPYTYEKVDDLQENEVPPLNLLPPRNPQTEQIVFKPNNRNIKVNFPSNYKATTPVYPSEDELTKDLQEKFKNSDSNPEFPTNEGVVNFQSNYKATTPQYPTSVDTTSLEPSEAGILPPAEGKSNIKINFESRFKATTPNYPTFVEQTSPNPKDAGLLPPKESSENGNNIVINFSSNFKATTPNYPTHVDPTSPDPGQAGVLPPKDNDANNEYENAHVNFESNYKATTPKYPTYVDPTSPNPKDVGLLPPKQKVVYKSRFKATTPKYPAFVEATSLDPSSVGLVAPRKTVVNFHSDFRATTPSYPTHVDSTSPDPGEAGLLAPQPPNLFGLVKSNISPSDNDKEFSNNYNLPAKFYQPPSLEPDYAEGEDDLQEIPGIKLSNFMKSFNREQWQELRQAFKIPEYDFPLDDATRPSYDSIVNSFEPIPVRRRNV